MPGHEGENEGGSKGGAAVVCETESEKVDGDSVEAAHKCVREASSVGV